MCCFCDFYRGACGNGRNHGIRPEHEPHCARHGRHLRSWGCILDCLPLAWLWQSMCWLTGPHGNAHAAVQHAAKAVVTPVMNLLLNRASPLAEYRLQDISPYFWANGKLPTCEEWKILAAHGFKDYRLKVHGLIENPMELSLDELRALGKKTQITLHHCIQGWSGIAEWGGAPLAELIKLVRPETRFPRGCLLFLRRRRSGRPVL